MRRESVMILLMTLCVFGLTCSKKPQKDYPIKPVAFNEVDITDSFWLPRMEANREVTIPFAFKKCEETGRIDNFAKAAELEEYMDDLIAKVAASQEKDGYLYTNRTIDPKNPAPGAGEKRWSNLGSSHELYNVGHMYEAAVAYYQATGKRTFLDVALKNADLIAGLFGPDGLKEFPGHQEIEIGLVKLFRVTGEEKYLDLAKFFLDVRGNKEYKKMFDENSDFSIYNQDWYLQAHKPVIKQSQAIGHAVRATYMYSGMADVAAMNGDTAYITAIDRIWDDVVSKKLYLTGGIGSRHEGEAFGDAYELPNNTAYNETCAAIGNVFWNFRLFLLHGEAKYLDVLERTLYNGLLSGISLSGDLFFYPNPLESDGKFKFNQGALSRKPWFDCACCPGNLARFLPSLPGYIYAVKDQTLYVNLFTESEGKAIIAENYVNISQKTNYPWDGNIQIYLEPKKDAEFYVNVRIPGWARNEPVASDLYKFLQPSEEKISLKVNSKDQALDMGNGFARLFRKWKKGDVIELVLPMPVRRVIALENVAADRGKAALQRGPIVYCFEGVDNNGQVLNRFLPDELDFEVEFRPQLLGGIDVLAAKDTAEDIQLLAYA